MTIYSNASVLGGETVVGENTIIGGNTFITESVPANTKVSAKSPELVIKKSRSAVSKTDVWDWQDLIFKTDKTIQNNRKKYKIKII